MAFEELDVFLSFSSNARVSVENIKKFFRIIKDMGYTGVIFGMTDTFDLPDEPYFGYFRCKYTKEELKEINRYAKELGLYITPHFQHLGHTGPLGKYNTYYQIAEDRQVLMEGDERVYALVDKIVAFLRECFDGDRLQLGMDEAFMMGRGKHLDKHGFEPFLDIMSRQLERVRNICIKYGFTRFETWSDMYLYRIFDPKIFDLPTEEVRKIVKEKLPDDTTLSHWDYCGLDKEEFRRRIERHFKLTDYVNYTAATLTWTGYTPDNGHSFKVLENNINVCREFKIKKINMAMWFGSGCDQGMYNGLPGLFFAAELCYGRTKSLANLDKKRFKEITGVEFDDFMLLDLGNKPHDDYEYNMYNAKSFFYTFQDVLLGQCDMLLSPNTNVDYAKQVKKFEGVNGGDFQYWFDIVKSHCKILSQKAELGLQLQKAYKEGDRKTIKYYAKKVIPEIINGFEEFYSAVKALNKAEFKGGSGFEVVNYRFGGAKKRLSRIAERLLDYAKGKIDFIEELEDERLKICTFNPNPTENNYALFGWNILTSFGNAT